VKLLKWITGIFLSLVIGGYFIVLVEFEKPIRIDATDSIQISTTNEDVILPWYLCIGTTYEGKLSGVDMQGKQYTWFYYTLSGIFGSAEMNCIIDWDTHSAIIFIGESRAMDVIHNEFPLVQWK